VRLADDNSNLATDTRVILPKKYFYKNNTNESQVAEEKKTDTSCE
jgi:hypothetical protein